MTRGAHQAVKERRGGLPRLFQEQQQAAVRGLRGGDVAQRSEKPLGGDGVAHGHLQKGNAGV